MKQTEHWNLYLAKEHFAVPWPWSDISWDRLGEAPPAFLPYSTDDFTRYPPGDGSPSMSGVPADLPRELPACVTQMGVYHDEDNVYVMVNALRPEQTIPELADHDGEDLTCIFEAAPVGLGLYFGLNQDGEATCLPKAWDKDLLTPEDLAAYPWSQLEREPFKPLDLDHEARVIRHEKGLLAAWRVGREHLDAGMDGNRIRFTAGRRCYATAELVSWTSNVVWDTRPDELGTLVFVDEPTAPRGRNQVLGTPADCCCAAADSRRLCGELRSPMPPGRRRAQGRPSRPTQSPRKENLPRPRTPRIRRIDLTYEPADETAVFTAHWDGVWSPERVERSRSQHYQDRLGLYTVALNGQERTGSIEPVTRDEFHVPDGWNRLEYLNAAGQPPLVVSFQKVSGRRIVPGAKTEDGQLPSEAELAEQFRQWHAETEQTYCAPGTWGRETGVPSVKEPVHCLDHNGVFWMEPYALACLHLERRAEYEERVRETCERVLSHERDGHWYPCLCVDPEGAEPFQGGAFAHGSVCEALVLGHRVLDEVRYLEASVRAVEAYRQYLWEDNQNYCAFALWHLAELYAQTRSAEALDWGLYYLQFAGSQIGLSGAQGGHNYYSGYGAITLKGLAKFLGVLPEAHPRYPWLRDKVIRFSNQMISRQQPSGLFAERNRKYLGYHSLEPAVGLFEAASALGGDVAGDLKPVLLSAYQAQREGTKRNGSVIVRMARHVAEIAGGR